MRGKTGFLGIKHTDAGVRGDVGFGETTALIDGLKHPHSPRFDDQLSTAVLCNLAHGTESVKVHFGEVRKGKAAAALNDCSRFSLDLVFGGNFGAREVRALADDQIGRASLFDGINKILCQLGTGPVSTEVACVDQGGFGGVDDEAVRRGNTVIDMDGFDLDAPDTELVSSLESVDLLTLNVGIKVLASALEPCFKDAAGAVSHVDRNAPIEQRDVATVVRVSVRQDESIDVGGCAVLGIRAMIEVREVRHGPYLEEFLKPLRRHGKVVEAAQDVERLAEV